MTKLRLVADDLTGALDSAAQFAGPGREIPVFMGHAMPPVLPPEFALDSASRERDPAAAAAIAAHHAPILAPSRGTVSFMKLDSLLRGHPGAELAAIMRAIRPGSCVVAPAFPFHGRVTREGLQWAARGGSWHRAGEDLKAALESQGMAVMLMRPGAPVPKGISLWDAETDEDLRLIVDSGRVLPGPVLWCGSGGLAAALAGASAPAVLVERIGRPMLGLFGSDHPVTAAQLGRCGDVVAARDLGVSESARVSAMLGENGVCLVRFEFSPGLGRAEAAARMATGLAGLAGRIPQPRSLLVAGGETLRSLCLSLGTGHLSVSGQVIPGVPVSRMVGGRWDRTEVVSKSGAFGDESLLARIALRRGA